MWRGLLSILSSVSLVVCLGTVLLWARSYWRYDLIGRAAPGVGTELVSLSGRMVFYDFNGYSDEPPPQQWGRNSGTLTSPEGTRLKREFDFSHGSRLNRAGFVWTSSPIFGPGTVMRVVSVPDWLVVMLSVPLGAVAASRIRREFARDK